MTSFGQHAEENLQFIRRTMERSSTFTAVPGLGGAGMGAIGLAAAVLAANQPSPERWLVVWLLAGAVALGCAARLAAAEQASEAPRLAALRDQLEVLLLRDIPDLVAVGAAGSRAPHILTIAVAGADSETLLMHLDMQGVAASGGSACSTGAKSVVSPRPPTVSVGLS